MINLLILFLLNLCIIHENGGDDIREFARILLVRFKGEGYAEEYIPNKILN